MTKCNKYVGELNCEGKLIKHGLVSGRQRYRCKYCRSTRMELYINKACNLNTNIQIINHVKEGCQIRSISGLLEISTGTVISRIKKIADQIKKPNLSIGKNYEVINQEPISKIKMMSAG